MSLEDDSEKGRGTYHRDNEDFRSYNLAVLVVHLDVPHHYHVTLHRCLLALLKNRRGIDDGSANEGAGQSRESHLDRCFHARLKILRRVDNRMIVATRKGGRAINRRGGEALEITKSRSAKTNED